MQLDELSRERQPESRALHFLVRRFDLAELLEDHVLVFRRDTDAGVADGDLHTAVGRRRPYLDPTARWRELDRVREQVQQHYTAACPPSNGNALRTIASKTGWTSVGAPLMILRMSAVACCWSRASTSRFSRSRTLASSFGDFRAGSRLASAFLFTGLARRPIHFSLPNE